jgi:hypothetical protein
MKGTRHKPSNFKPFTRYSYCYYGVDCKFARNKIKEILFSHVTTTLRGVNHSLCCLITTRLHTPKAPAPTTHILNTPPSAPFH